MSDAEFRECQTNADDLVSRDGVTFVSFEPHVTAETPHLEFKMSGRVGLRTVFLDVRFGGPQGEQHKFKVSGRSFGKMERISRRGQDVHDATMYLVLLKFCA